MTLCFIYKNFCEKSGIERVLYSPAESFFRIELSLDKRNVSVAQRAIIPNLFDP